MPNIVPTTSEASRRLENATKDLAIAVSPMNAEHPTAATSLRLTRRRSPIRRDHRAVEWMMHPAGLLPRNV